jgi:hypothetical protein
MKRLSFFLLLSVFACKEVSYKEPQPKEVKPLAQIPAKLYGNYLFKDDKGNPDTIVIAKKGFYAKSDPKDLYALSDSLVMKSHRDYYFISKNENPEWLLRVIHQEKNGDISYMSMDYGDNFNIFLQRLSLDTRVDSLEVNGEKLYQIDPSAKELMDILNKGYFKEVVLKKIN